MSHSKVSTRALVFLLLAYFISVTVRYIWVYHAHLTPDMLYHGIPLIVSVDGYHYMIDARKMLLGQSGAVGFPLSLLTTYLIKLLPFSFESIAFYMSAFLSSLIVIPVFYIMKRFGSDLLAFAAALISAVIISYYRRTMAGYYDTDMLVIVFPMFIYWFLIESIERKSSIYAFFLLLSVVFFALWLPSDIALNLSITGTFLIYTLIFKRKSFFHYTLFLAMFVAATPVAFTIKAPVLVLLLLFLHYENRLNKKISIALLILFMLSFVAFMALYHEVIVRIIAQKLAYYLHNTSTSHGMHYANSASFVQEDSKISYSEFAKRASGNIFVLPLALTGYIVMILKKKHRVMLLLLPMIAFGLMAYGIPGLNNGAGLRFVMYLAPVVGISLAYFIVWSEIIIKQSFRSNYYARYLLLLAFLYPNIAHTFAYNPQENSVTRENIAGLEHTKHQITPNDTVISWWDYGYILQYFTNAKTVADGGWQLGRNLYPISLMLLSESQSFSVKLARLIAKVGRNNGDHNYLYAMMQHYHYHDPVKFLNELASSKIEIKPNSFDTYLYFPKQIITLYPAMDAFARTDLATGKLKNVDKYYFLSKKAVNLKKDNFIIIGKNIVYIKSKEQLFFTKQNAYMNIKAIYRVSYNKGRTFSVDVQHTRYSEGYTLISLDDGRVLIADDVVFNSLIVQLGVLQNYDPKLFEPILLSTDTKIYRLKKR
jgi:hypothetical protein